MEDIEVETLTVAELMDILGHHKSTDTVTVDVNTFEEGVICISGPDGMQIVRINDNF